MKFQCYYNETVWYNGVAHTGKRVDTECFYTEEEAEKYCRWNVGITEHNDGTYEEHEMHYEEIEERMDNGY